MSEDSLTMDEFCRNMRLLLDRNLPISEIVGQVKPLLLELVSSPGIARDLLRKLALDEQFTAGFFPAIDPNDITLYREPGGRFSVRLFVWEPHTLYLPHDHGSWGVIAPLAQCTRETRYRRIDDGSREGYAELEVTGEAVLSPGEVTHVMPLNDGIHCLAPSAEAASLTLHVYGFPMRKGFIQSYHPQERMVFRTYSRTKMLRITAIHAVGALAAPWSEEILEQAVSDPLELIRDESRKTGHRMNKPRLR